MAKKNETLINLLTQVPWWVSVVLAAIFYVVLKFIVPAIEFQSFALKGIINAAPQIAHLVAFVILIPAPVAAFNAWRKRKLFHSQKDLNSVRSLSWREFEELVAEVYRRQGYTVMLNGMPKIARFATITLPSFYNTIFYTFFRTAFWTNNHETSFVKLKFYDSMAILN